MIIPTKTAFFTPTEFRSNSSAVFNAVQSDGLVVIESKSRPDMTLMLKSEHDAMIEKIRQLADLLKSLESGDSKNQLDLLKG
jgi:PHD/YefM family antitoxin component YafN of YafNO toxin-antitoxin module